MSGWNKYNVESSNAPEAMELLVLCPESYSERLVVPDRQTSASITGRSGTSSSSPTTPSVRQPGATQADIAQPPVQPSQSPAQTSRSNGPRGESNMTLSAPRRKRGSRVSRSTRQPHGSFVNDELGSSSESENGSDEVFKSPDDLDITTQRK